MDTDLPLLRGLYVRGTLEFPVDRSNVLNVTCMVIAGGELRVGESRALGLEAEDDIIQQVS